MNLADTPRVDAEVVILPSHTDKYVTQNTHWVAASTARTLEREVNYWRNELMMLKERLNEK